MVAQNVTRDPSNIETVNQMVLQNEQGDQFQIKIFPGMSAEAVRVKIDALKIEGRYTVVYNAAEEHLDWLNRLLEELWPGAPITELASTEPGVQRVRGVLHLQWTDHYYRAQAKMEFHYYLQYNDGGVRGDEPEFAAIRRFIMEGGDHTQFFKSKKDSPVAFETPYGDAPGGGVFGPAEWQHLLAAGDSTGIAMAFLQLFLGPGGIVQDPYIIVLGARPASARGDGGQWSHLLRWEPGSKKKGEAIPHTLMRG